MSTRSQIEFRHTKEWTDYETDEDHSETNRLLTYKHSDGYPQTVIPLIRKYWSWSGRTNDIEYFTAGWFYYVKRRYEEAFGHDADNWESYTGTQTGHGICADGKLHGDIEHTYVVDMNEKVIKHYSAGRNHETVDDLEDSREPTEVYDLEVGDYRAEFK